MRTLGTIALMLALGRQLSAGIPDDAQPFTRHHRRHLEAAVIIGLGLLWIL